MPPRGKEQRELAEAREGKEGFSPRAVRGSIDTLTADFWLPELCENKYLLV